jgi:5'-nucleotidase
VKAFAGTVDLYVSAPAQNQSGKGHSITIGDPIIVRERHLDGVTRALAIEATPATAMRVGLEKFVGKQPDLVISGINRGENLGTAVYLSGTLGAAREAVFTGIPAIAVSIGGNAPEDYAATAQLIKRMVDDLRARQMLRPGFFINVNAPAGTPKGMKITRLSVLASKQLYDCTSFVRERAACFSGYEQVKADGPDTDVQAFFEGYVTVTPLSLDSTDATSMSGLSVLAGAAGAK